MGKTVKACCHIRRDFFLNISATKMCSPSGQSAIEIRPPAHNWLVLHGLKAISYLAWPLQLLATFRCVYIKHCNPSQFREDSCINDFDSFTICHAHVSWCCQCRPKCLHKRSQHFCARRYRWIKSKTESTVWGQQFPDRSCPPFSG